MVLKEQFIFLHVSSFLPFRPCEKVIPPGENGPDYSDFSLFCVLLLLLLDMYSKEIECDWQTKKLDGAVRHGICSAIKDSVNEGRERERCTSHGKFKPRPLPRCRSTSLWIQLAEEIVKTVRIIWRARDTLKDDNLVRTKSDNSILALVSFSTIFSYLKNSKSFLRALKTKILDDVTAEFVVVWSRTKSWPSPTIYMKQVGQVQTIETKKKYISFCLFVFFGLYRPALTWARSYIRFGRPFRVSFLFYSSYLRVYTWRLPPSCYSLLPLRWY